MTDRLPHRGRLPLEQVSLDSVHEKSVRHGYISILHIWPARRPPAASRAALIATLLPDPGNAGRLGDAGLGADPRRVRCRRLVADSDRAAGQNARHAVPPPSPRPSGSSAASARPGWDTAVLAEMRANITLRLRGFRVASIREPDLCGRHSDRRSSVLGGLRSAGGRVNRPQNRPKRPLFRSMNDCNILE